MSAASKKKYKDSLTKMVKMLIEGTKSGKIRWELLECHLEQDCFSTRLNDTVHIRVAPLALYLNNSYNLFDDHVSGVLDLYKEILEKFHGEYEPAESIVERSIELLDSELV